MPLLGAAAVLQARKFGIDGTIEAPYLPHEPPLSTVFPVVPQVRVEGTGFALDLPEVGFPGLVMPREPKPAVLQDPAAPLVGA